MIYRSIRWDIMYVFAGTEITALDYIVGNHKIFNATYERAVQHNIPVVSSEWVIQCFIMGTRPNPNAHKKYKHDYDE